MYINFISRKAIKVIEEWFEENINIKKHKMYYEKRIGEKGLFLPKRFRFDRRLRMNLQLFAGTVYYVDYSNSETTSADTNNGTSISTAWIHEPGDDNATGTSDATTLSAGDTIVFKGGVEYDGLCKSKANGSSGNYISYISGDQHGTPWGSGRAVINAENTRIGCFNLDHNYNKVLGLEMKNVPDIASSRGILVNGDYNLMQENYIHDLFSSTSGWGILLEASAQYNTVTKNNLIDVGDKAIEMDAGADNNTVTYNYVNGTEAHGIVPNGDHNEVAYNIITRTGETAARRPGYAIKSEGSGANASYNKIHHNMIWDGSDGIAIIGGDYNEVMHNVVYYIGHGDLEESGEDSQGMAFSLLDSNWGYGDPVGNIIKNNLFLYSSPKSSDYMALCYATGIGADNEIKNNCAFYSSGEVSTIVNRKTYGGGHTAQSIAEFEGVGGISNIETGNVASGNQAVDPKLYGGDMGSVTNLPTGFDANWIPNDIGFKLTSNTPDAIKDSLNLSSPYNIDIESVTRTIYSMGAYEYVGNQEIDDTEDIIDSIGTVKLTTKATTRSKSVGLTIS